MRLTVLAVLFALPACVGGTETGQWVVDTLPGPILVARNTGPGTWVRDGVAPWSIGAATIVGRGGVGTRDTVTFVDLVDLEVDTLGRVYLLDRRANQIRVFASDGTPVRTVGGYGRGPGELNGAQGMAFDPIGRLWVLNAGNARYTVYDSAGRLLREYPYPLGSTRYTGWLGTFSPTGQLFDWSSFRIDDRLVRRVAPYDTAAGRFVGTPVVVRWPVAPPLWLVTRTSPLGWWAASAAEYRIFLLSLSGDTLRIIQRDDYQPVPLETSNSRTSPPGRTMVRGSVLEPPNHQRIAASIIEDDSEHLWIAHWSRPESSTTMLDVFASAGEFLGTVEVPYRLEDNPRPVIRGDRLFGVTRDQDDVQSLVILRLRRVSPPLP